MDPWIATAIHRGASGADYQQAAQRPHGRRSLYFHKSYTRFDNLAVEPGDTAPLSPGGRSGVEAATRSGDGRRRGAGRESSGAACGCRRPSRRRGASNGRNAQTVPGVGRSACLAASRSPFLRDGCGPRNHRGAPSGGGGGSTSLADPGRLEDPCGDGRRQPERIRGACPRGAASRSGDRPRPRRRSSLAHPRSRRSMRPGRCGGTVGCCWVAGCRHLERGRRSRPGRRDAGTRSLLACSDPSGIPRAVL